jgi:hypothetical protein
VENHPGTFSFGGFGLIAMNDTRLLAKSLEGTGNAHVCQMAPIVGEHPIIRFKSMQTPLQDLFQGSTHRDRPPGLVLCEKYAKIDGIDRYPLSIRYSILIKVDLSNSEISYLSRV